MKLLFNIQECIQMEMGKNEADFDFYFDNKSFLKTTSHTDLCVTLSAYLQLNQYIEFMSSKTLKKFVK